MLIAGGAAFSFLIKRVPSSLKLVGRSIQLRKALTIRNPNALTKRSFGYTDKVSGSAFRQGRGPRIDYLTEKPIISSYNTAKLNKLGKSGMTVTGVGLTGLSLFYYYQKSKENK